MPDCAEGWLADRGQCVPEACGVGTWGALEVDENTVFVDIETAEAGNGGELAPLRSIQAGLELAGSRGGGLVAVAAGSYPETLNMDTNHADVHLAGRCRELVTVDASIGGEGIPGLDIAAAYGEVMVSGLAVVGSGSTGVKVGSGVVELAGMEVAGSAFGGIWCTRSSITASRVVTIIDSKLDDNELVGLRIDGTDTEVTVTGGSICGTRPWSDGGFGYGVVVEDGGALRVEHGNISGNTGLGLRADAPGTQVVLEDTIIRGTLPDEKGTGYGLDVYGEAQLWASGCELDSNAGIGVAVFDTDTRVTLVDSAVRGTQPHSSWGGGFGLQVSGGARLSAVGCALMDNTECGIKAAEPGTEISLVDTLVRDTSLGREGRRGRGIEVQDGCTLIARRCEVDGSTSVGIWACDPTTTANLVDTLVHGTRSNEVEESGFGLDIHGGATLRADACRLMGNSAVGVMVAQAGTEATLVDTTIERTLPYVLGDGGMGVQVCAGASLSALRCELSENRAVGMSIGDPGTVAELTECTVRDTLPGDDGEGGKGIQVTSGASLILESCELDANTEVGLVASDPGTHVAIRTSSITGTTIGFSQKSAIAPGLCAQTGATIAASGLLVQRAEGPGLYAVAAGELVCSNCTLLDNQFAGGAVLDAGRLEILESTVSLGVASANLDGGVGVFAVQQFDMAPPSLAVTDSAISDNRLAGVYVAGEGSYALIGNEITGSTAVSHGNGSRCGDGVFASGVSAWEATQGLQLEGNTLTDNQGAGLFLDDGRAQLSGNSWSGNAPDLLVQGEACLEPGADYPEAPEAEICPTWDQPTCELYLALNLAIAEIPTALGPTPMFLHAPSAGSSLQPVENVELPLGARDDPNHHDRAEGRRAQLDGRR